MYEVVDEKKLYQLFLERERLKINAKNFLDSHQDSNGKILKSEAEFFEENFMTEIKHLDREVAKEMGKPTSKPILMNPQNNNLFGGVGNNKKAQFGVTSANYHDSFFKEVRNKFRTAFNYLNEGNDGQGGYLVPSEFHDEIVSQLREENVLRQIGRVVTTASDREIAIQSTAPTADFVAEGANIPLSTEEFERKTLKAYKLAAGVSVSNELLQDSFYDVESHLQLEFGKALARREEQAMLIGTGMGEPLGLVTAMLADTSTTITSAGTSITADDIINLVYSVSAPYRRNASFLMSDQTLAAVRKLKDNTQNYIWEKSLSLNEPSTLLGFPIYSSEYMPSIASENICLLFGDFTKYILGQRGEMQFKPLYEINALQDLTSYLMIERIDGVLSDKFAIRGLKIA